MPRIPALAGRTVAIFIDFSFEDLEVTYPKVRLEEEGAKVILASSHPAGTKFTGKHGYPLKSDVCVDALDASTLHGLVLPGGFAPDYMRRSQRMLDIIIQVAARGAPVAAICHGPWMLCSARLPDGRPICSGRHCTCFVAIKDDVVNAGAIFVDEPVCVDGPLITSRTPADLTPFLHAIIDAVAASGPPPAPVAQAPSKTAGTAALRPITSFADPAWAWRGEGGVLGVHRNRYWGIEGEVLGLIPRAQRDYWSRTFYEPPLVKRDGHYLFAPVPAEAEATLSLGFTFNPRSQFDQAGAFLRAGEHTWVKAGIEYADREVRLSCVVTNAGFSDWSTAIWPHWNEEARITTLRLRVHKLLPGAEQGHCVVVEAAPYSPGDTATSEPEAFSFVRIASVRPADPDAAWEIGPSCFAPVAAGCSAEFHYVQLGEKMPLTHGADSTSMTSS